MVVTTDEGKNGGAERGTPVVQFDDDADTLTADFAAMFDERGGLRATTCSDWPPEPPPPAELEAAIAQGTTPPVRNAGFYAAVRRPTTSGDLT
jgi:hypothetical protein